MQLTGGYWLDMEVRRKLKLRLDYLLVTCNGIDLSPSTVQEICELTEAIASLEYLYPQRFDQMNQQ